MDTEGKGLAVEWVKFARVNTVSPGYINTEISNFVPPETKKIWRQKTPVSRKERGLCRSDNADYTHRWAAKARRKSCKGLSYTWPLMLQALRREQISSLMVSPSHVFTLRTPG